MSPSLALQQYPANARKEQLIHTPPRRPALTDQEDADAPMHDASDDPLIVALCAKFTKLTLGPTFMQLPGEIRNRIYEFLFSRPVHYLERKEIQDSRLKPLRSTEDEIPPPTLQDVFRPVTPATLQRCGVRQPKKRHRGHIKELNQLKYVCRQLYLETKGLELQYAMLIFSCAAHRATYASTHLFNFAKFTPPMYLAWIRDVKLTGNIIGFPQFHLEPLDNLLKIARFCKDNPEATVKYVFDDLETPVPKALKPEPPVNYLFLDHVLFLKLALRDPDVADKLIGSASMHRALLHNKRLYAAAWRDGRSVQELKVSNLIFLPRNGLSQEDLERFYKFLTSPRVAPPWTTMVDLPAFVTIMRQQLKDGI